MDTSGIKIDPIKVLLLSREYFSKQKDQQIKDLTELVDAANNLLGCVPISSHPFRNTYLTNFDEYLKTYQSVNKSYQQKYPKP
jgi:CHASE3 domain sensor protein